jgi:hypothetical protein
MRHDGDQYLYPLWDGLCTPNFARFASINMNESVIIVFPHPSESIKLSRNPLLFEGTTPLTAIAVERNMRVV